jgi:8-oxo-dGTP pyrophosphatase MutT (NUDIX family)
MRELTVIALDRLDLGYAPCDWPYAQRCRGEIDAYFEELRRRKPALWNGRVLLMRDLAIANGTLRGSFFETGYADFLHWRNHGFPDRAVLNCFGMAALRSRDGAYLMGVMGPHTASAGSIYFPAGTPEPIDRRGATVDLLGNVLRELAEETGLAAQEVGVGKGWSAVASGGLFALFKPLVLDAPADELRARMLRHLAGEVRPELADIRIIRSTRDFDPHMPDFMIAYLGHRFAAGD